MDANDEAILGMRYEYGQDTPFGLSTLDRRHHVYVVGKSGTGKTSLLHNMMVQDIAAGRGFAFLDPHGDEARELLDYIPADRVKHVVYFDPSDEEFAMQFNLLTQVPAARRHLVASGIVAAFKGIYPDFFGPRMEYIFNAAVAALLDCDNVSLLGLQKMLIDERYRAWVVQQVKDPVVRAFWRDEFEAHDRRTKAEMVSPILNKIGPILMAPHLRGILGQIRRRIDIRWMMDNGRIFIANLSKGKLGPDKANLMGSFLVTQFQLAAMERCDVPERERRDFTLFVDEFQSFVSDSFITILSEARKYRLSLVLGHQYLDQVKTEILKAVLGNVGSVVAFRVGHEDAAALEKAFGGAYIASQFTELGNGEALVKLLRNGRDQQPFLGKMHPPGGVRHGRSGKVVGRSREKFATPRGKVEAQIAAWFERGSSGFN